MSVKEHKLELVKIDDIPEGMKYCECGCGELIKIMNKNGLLHYKFGHSNKGKKFPGRIKSEIGSNNNAWKGGRIITKKGYVMIRCENHPNATHKGKYILEHHLIIENILGRCLIKGEVVHHINGDKQDNRLENLALLKNNEHSSLHRNKELSEGKILFNRDFI
jgi:hypothetical protein